MAVINDLPNELLADIVSGLASSDLLNLSRVSHKFLAVSEPFLYKEPHLVTNTRVPDSVKAFIQALIAPGRQPLAGKVNSLTVACENTVCTDDITPDLRSLASRCRMDKFSITSQDTLVTILLHLLPRLHTFNVCNLETGVAFHRMLSLSRLVMPTGLPLALQSLREFRCERRNNMGGLAVKTLLMLLDLPSIRTIVSDIIDQTIVLPTSTEPTSRVKSLSLAFDDMKVWSLCAIIRRLHATERFSYTITDSYITSHSARLGKALLPLKSTLRYLRLDCATLTEVYYTNTDDDTFKIGSLREWPVLRTVISSLLPLLGTGLVQPPPRLVDVLPESLCEIEILGDQYWSCVDAIGEVRKMLSEKTGLVPMLEKVAVSAVGSRKSMIEERLKGACEEVGVMFVDDSSGW